MQQAMEALAEARRIHAAGAERTVAIVDNQNGLYWQLQQVLSREAVLRQEVQEHRASMQKAAECIQRAVDALAPGGAAPAVAASVDASPPAQPPAGWSGAGGSGKFPPPPTPAASQAKLEPTDDAAPGSTPGGSQRSAKRKDKERRGHSAGGGHTTKRRRPRGPVGQHVRGRSPLAQRDLSKEDFNRIKCMVGRVVAHGGSVPGTDVRGARSSDQLELLRPLWAFRGWLPLKAVAQLLNVRVGVIRDVLHQVPGHYETWQGKGSPDVWMRATKGANWMAVARRRCAEDHKRYGRWQRLVRDGDPEFPLPHPNGRARRAPRGPGTDEEVSSSGSSSESATDENK